MLPIDMVLVETKIRDIQLSEINTQNNILTKELKKSAKSLLAEVYLLKKFKNNNINLPYFEKIENIQCLDYTGLESMDEGTKKKLLDSLFMQKKVNRLFLLQMLKPQTFEVLQSILKIYNDQKVPISSQMFYSVFNILSYSAFSLENPFNFNFDELMLEVKQLINLYENGFDNQNSFYHSFFNKKILIIGSTFILSSLLISLGLPSIIGNIFIKTIVSDEF